MIIFIIIYNATIYFLLISRIWGDLFVEPYIFRSVILDFFFIEPKKLFCMWLLFGLILYCFYFEQFDSCEKNFSDHYRFFCRTLFIQQLFCWTLFNQQRFCWTLFKQQLLCWTLFKPLFSRSIVTL